jgi:hypothetical protein
MPIVISAEDCGCDLHHSAQPRRAMATAFAVGGVWRARQAPASPPRSARSLKSGDRRSPIGSPAMSCGWNTSPAPERTLSGEGVSLRIPAAVSAVRGAFPSASLAPRRRINPCDRVGLSTAPPSARCKSGQLRVAATIRHRPNDSLRGVSTERVMTRMGATATAGRTRNVRFRNWKWKKRTQSSSNTASNRSGQRGCI